MRIGTGSVGVGHILMDGTSKTSPWNSKKPPAMRPRMMAISSSIRLPRRSQGTPQIS